MTVIDRDVLARLIYPLRSSASRCTVTPRKLEIPNALPISRIEGGYPLSFTYSRMNFRIRSCLSVSPLVIVKSPCARCELIPASDNKCTPTVFYCQAFQQKNLKIFLPTCGYARMAAHFAFDNPAIGAVR